ncbi:nuclease-related domain-containing protein [Phocicoccus schoeneichii]|uniref:nuclease-related domain-containing protein n=1 Tax=Phocicoccus schoeneichii TaxID=1812261 RepID=UPI001640E867|nr:nuclease-related domain-containing protein [Jeotgalicoccus schoeneichii]
MKRRMNFSDFHQEMLYKNKVGFLGEKKFHERLKRELNSDVIQLYDVKLRAGESECQIDCLLIFQYECVILELKNYGGNFVMRNNDWFLISGKQIDNPVNQLQRQRVRLEKFFEENKINLKINQKLVFINPKFVLYEAKRDFNVIMPGQIDWLIEELNRIPCRVYEHQQKIVDTIQTKSLKKSRYETDLDYEYDRLFKGITCVTCESFVEFDFDVSRKKVQCPKCGESELVDAAVLRNIKDYIILFPEEQLTVGRMLDWMGFILSKQQIRRILNKYGAKQGSGRKTYYVIDNNKLN